MEYSIVIPVHNEAAHLETQVSRFVESLPVDLAVLVKEIILVENGSTDSTSEVCGKLESRYPLLVRPVCIARGATAKQSTRDARMQGNPLSILECDVLDCDFVARSVAVFRTTDTEVLVGSKRLPEAVDRRPIKRRALTYLYNAVFLRLCMGYPRTDTHGLKSFQTPVAQGLCAKAVTTDEVFQTEIILLAWRCGFRIKEIPLSIEETRASAISIRRRLPTFQHNSRASQFAESLSSAAQFRYCSRSGVAVKTSAPANK